MKTIKTFIYSIIAYCAGFILLGIAICIIYLFSALNGIYLSVPEMALCEMGLIFFIVFVLSVLFGIIKKKKAFEFVKRLATFPSRHNYNWQGGYSLFTFVILYVITFFRSIFFSIKNGSGTILSDNIGFAEFALKPSSSNSSTLF